MRRISAGSQPTAQPNGRGAVSQAAGMQQVAPAGRGPGAAGRGQGMREHRKAAAIVLAAVMLAGVAGWIAGSQIDSPAEIASRTAPPPASAILVAAEERTLSTDIVTRGTARFGSPQQLASAPSLLKTGAGVAARLPLAGTELNEGSVVYTTSGRPVFLLMGEQPTFRDVGPGLSGADVRQLEEALARLGFDPGPVDGVYDGQTEAAVSVLYKGAGFAPFTASAEQLAVVRAREADQNIAQIDVISAQEAVAMAEAALDAARAAHTRAVEVSAASPAAVAAAVATAAANNRAAAAEVAWKQAAHDALVDSGATPAEIAAAKAEIAFAQATADATRLAGESDTAAAQAAASEARAAVTSTLREVGTAEALLQLARDALRVRQRQADLVASDVAIAKLQAGVQMPADELIFVANTPVRVSEVTMRTDVGGGPLITVTNAIVAIDGSLRLEEASLATPGMRVVIDEPDLNINATGVISRVAEAPGTNGVDGFHVYFEVIVDGSLPTLVGASVRLTVPVEATGGSVLAVPLNAVTLAADGSSRVQRDNNGKLEFVTVKPGLAADGFVAVTPVDGDLEPGDMVVIGFDQGAASR